MIDLVGTRTELRRAGASRYQGLCPFHDERTPVVRDRPVDEALPLLRLRQGRRLLLVRRGDRGAALPRGAAVPGRPLRGRAGGRGRGSAGGRAPARGASGCWSCWSARRRSTCATCGSRARPAGAREYLAERGLEEGTLREFRVGYAPSAWDTRAARVAPREVLQRGDRGGGAGGPRQGRRQDLRPLPAPDHVPAVRRARARAGLRRARAGRRPAAEVPQLARGRASTTRVVSCSRSTSRARRPPRRRP